MYANIVIDLTFGDSGKGITTDFLSKDKNSVVIRFSGGQQAGHNVKIGDLSHIHSSYGSGTLRGIPTYISEHCTFYPNSMLRENEVLKTKGINPSLTIHPLAKITTPGDVAYNRLTQLKLKHGSCGMGVGPTMARNINTGYKLHAIDLTNETILFQKIYNIMDYYFNQISDVGDSNYFNQYAGEELQNFRKAYKELDFNIESYDYLSNFDDLIFEGSQGIMLDMDHGVFPNVTYANTTSKNAIEICDKIGLTDEIEIFYITRCYQTRHGKGWMSNQKNIELINTENEINTFNEWQKEFKIGEIDYDLLNYALGVDKIYSNDVVKNLVVTCLDQRPDFKFDYSKLKQNFTQIYNSYSPDSKDFKKLQ